MLLFMEIAAYSSYSELGFPINRNAKKCDTADDVIAFCRDREKCVGGWHLV